MSWRNIFDALWVGNPAKIPDGAPKYDYSPLALPERRWRIRIGILFIALLIGVITAYPQIFALVVISVMLAERTMGNARLDSQRRRLQIVNNSIDEFAKRNDLESIMPLIPPALLGPMGRARGSAHNSYVFMLGNTPCQVCDFSYEVYAGRSTKEYRFGVACMPNPKAYPHLYLDGMQNGPSDAYQQSQRISLEGDFDKFFNLYAPEHEVVDALSIITPDVMQTLVDGGRPYDIEIYGDNIFVITKETAYTINRLPSLLAFCTDLMRELDERNLSWQPLKLTAQNWHRDLLYRAKVYNLGFIILAFAIVVFYFASLLVQN